MELKDTIEMMTSNDYKERFKAEYHQVERYTEFGVSFNHLIPSLSSVSNDMIPNIIVSIPRNQKP